MSSILAFLAAAAVRVIPSRDIEVSRLQAKIDGLTRDNEQLTEERNRWMALSDRWQQRYEDLMRPQEQRLQAQMMQAQAQQQMYGQLQQQHDAYSQQNLLNQSQMNQVGQAMLGMQALNSEMFCNCVPARHDLFLPR